MNKLYPSSSVRFGVVTDSHYADRDPVKINHHRESLMKMEEFIEVMNREAVDFIVHLGDFKDQDEPPDERTTRLFLVVIGALLCAGDPSEGLRPFFD